MDDLVGIREVSQKLGIKTSTLYYWAKRGLIPAYRLNGLWRFDMAQVEAWITASRFQPQRHVIMKQNSPKKSIDHIIKNAIEQVTGKGYNDANGKPGHGSSVKGGHNGAL